MRYNNPKFDKIVQKSRTTVDQKERKKYLKKANAIAVKDAVWVPMYHGIVTVALDKSVNGLKLYPTSKYTVYKVHRK